MSPEELDEILVEKMAWAVGWNGARDALEAVRPVLLAEVDRLREQAERVERVEKMAREANAAAIEQWNRADALAADLAAERARVERVRALAGKWMDHREDWYYAVPVLDALNDFERTGEPTMPDIPIRFTDKTPEQRLEAIRYILSLAHTLRNEEGRWLLAYVDDLLSFRTARPRSAIPVRDAAMNPHMATGKRGTTHDRRS